MDSNVVVTQATSAAIFVYVMQQLKAASWFPWLKDEGQIALKRVISVLAAITIHTGIHFIWNPGTGEVWRQVVINLPTPWIMLVTIWHWAGQFVTQELIYQITGNKAVQVQVKP